MTINLERGMSHSWHKSNIFLITDQTSIIIILLCHLFTASVSNMLLHFQHNIGVHIDICMWGPMGVGDGCTMYNNYCTSQILLSYFRHQKESPGTNKTNPYIYNPTISTCSYPSTVLLSGFYPSIYLRVGPLMCTHKLIISLFGREAIDSSAYTRHQCKLQQTLSLS